MLVRIKYEEKDIHHQRMPLFLYKELLEVVRQDQETTKVQWKNYSYTFRNSAILKTPSER